MKMAEVEYENFSNKLGFLLPGIECIVCGPK